MRLGTAAGEAGFDLPEEVRRARKQLARRYIPARYADAHAAGSAADHYDADDSQQAVADFFRRHELRPIHSSPPS